MKMIKKVYIFMLSLTLVASMGIHSIEATDEYIESDYSLSGNAMESQVNQDNNLNYFLENDEGTFTIRFKPQEMMGLGSLISLSNSKLENNYFSLYYNSGSVGIEYRNQNGSHIINKKNSTSKLTGDSWHTVTLTYSPKDMRFMVMAHSYLKVT